MREEATTHQMIRTLRGPARPHKVRIALGTCSNCGRQLSNPVSGLIGIGPECLKKLRHQQANSKALSANLQVDPKKIIHLVRGADGAPQTNIKLTIIHHSPDGFEWGYGGSGPADLALNILENVLQSNGYNGKHVKCYQGTCFQEAWRLHIDFKRQFIETMPNQGGAIATSRILDWILQHREKEPST